MIQDGRRFTTLEQIHADNFRITVIQPCSNTSTLEYSDFKYPLRFNAFVNPIIAVALGATITAVLVKTLP